MGNCTIANSSCLPRYPVVTQGISMSFSYWTACVVGPAVINVGCRPPCCSAPPRHQHVCAFISLVPPYALLDLLLKSSISPIFVFDGVGGYKLQKEGKILERRRKLTRNVYKTLKHEATPNPSVRRTRTDCGLKCFVVRWENETSLSTMLMVKVIRKL